MKRSEQSKERERKERARKKRLGEKERGEREKERGKRKEEEKTWREKSVGITHTQVVYAERIIGSKPIYGRAYVVTSATILSVFCDHCDRFFCVFERFLLFF